MDHICASSRVSNHSFMISQALQAQHQDLIQNNAQITYVQAKVSQTILVLMSLCALQAQHQDVCKNTAHTTYMQASVSNHTVCFMVLRALQAQHQDLYKTHQINHICASRRVSNHACLNDVVCFVSPASGFI